MGQWRIQRLLRRQLRSSLLPPRILRWSPRHHWCHRPSARRYLGLLRTLRRCVSTDSRRGSLDPRHRVPRGVAKGTGEEIGRADTKCVPRATEAIAAASVARIRKLCIATCWLHGRHAVMSASKPIAAKTSPFYTRAHIARWLWHTTSSRHDFTPPALHARAAAGPRGRPRYHDRSRGCPLTIRLPHGWAAGEPKTRRCYIGWVSNCARMPSLAGARAGGTLGRQQGERLGHHRGGNAFGGVGAPLRLVGHRLVGNKARAGLAPVQVEGRTTDVGAQRASPAARSLRSSRLLD